jgi:hypothetical protein
VALVWYVQYIVIIDRRKLKINETGMVSNSITFIANFFKIDQLVQKLKQGIARQDCELTNLEKGKEAKKYIFL